jgi:hypothetical protein
MVKKFVKKIGFAFMVLLLVQVIAFAQGTSGTEPDSPQEASFKSRCQKVPEGYPPCADSPSACGSDLGSSPCGFTPFNCIFLEEPIGGDPGFDLYRVTCRSNPTEGAPEGEEGETENECPSQSQICETVLWYGEAIVGNDRGPIQAILAYEEGKETQGPFGVVYSYLGLIYNFLSGIIIAFVVLIAIIGGIRMTTSAGNQEQFTAGKNMIIKALIGMVIWFTASVILYTINPTFFAF